MIDPATDGGLRDRKQQKLTASDLKRKRKANKINLKNIQKHTGHGTYHLLKGYSMQVSSSPITTFGGRHCHPCCIEEQAEALRGEVDHPKTHWLCVAELG